MATVIERGAPAAAPALDAPAPRHSGSFAPVALVTVTAATVLVAEIVATRTIAPYVGVTLETISAVIGCVLAGISIGNWLGGRFADSGTPRLRLGGALVAGGVALALAPWIVRNVGPHLTGRDPLSALLLTMSAFFVPSVLLSTTSPVVLKQLGRDRSHLGRVAGNVAAFATIGALAGNFGAGFFLVGNFRADAILVACGAVAVGLGCVLVVRSHHALPIALVAAMLGAGLIFAIGTAIEAQLPCTAETQYVCLDVSQTGRSEYVIRTDIYESSVTDTEEPSNLRLSYARDAAGAVAGLVDEPEHFLYIGAGGYTLPLYFADAYRDSQHTVLEIDQELVDVVTGKLGLRDHADRISTTIGDARMTVPQLGSARFDVVVADAFSGLSVPWHLTTAEFLLDVRAQLAPGGIYVMNVVDSGGYEFARATARTAESVFGAVAVLARPAAFLSDPGPNTNVVIVAGADLPNADELATMVGAFGSSSLALADADAAEFVDGAPVLTDQFAPVDQLLGSP